MYGFCGECCCIVTIIPFGMVWYVSKHKHKEDLGAFGSIVDRFEALWKRLSVFRALRERMGAFGRLGRLGNTKTFGRVWYGMYVSKHKYKNDLGTFGTVWERLEVFGKRLNAFRALCERIGAFGRLGRLGSIIPYVCMVWYVWYVSIIT